MFDLAAEQSVWNFCGETKRPILLYGMGDGADQILRAMEQFGAKASGVFASDGFVRGHSFAGFPVLSYSEAVSRFPDPVILLSFAVHTPEMLGWIQELSRRHTLFAPDVPVAGEGLFTPKYAAEHGDEIKRVYELLGDDLSRKTLEQVLRFKISGKPDSLLACQSPKEEAWQILNPGPAEHFVDLGAYNGDTIEEFLSVPTVNRQFETITAMEPDQRNFKKLQSYLDTLPETVRQNITAINAGAWEQTGYESFLKKRGRGSCIGQGTVLLPVETVDHAVSQPVSLIKMDVEGAEEKAILGAQETIRRDRPKLYLCAYHRNEDLFRLPLLIDSIAPGYRFYLRHHPYIPAWETNFYAVPEEKDR